MAREGTGHQPSYVEAKKMKSHFSSGQSTVFSSFSSSYVGYLGIGGSQVNLATVGIVTQNVAPGWDET